MGRQWQYVAYIMQNVKEKNYRNEAGDELHNACDIRLEIDVIEDEDVELKTTISSGSNLISYTWTTFKCSMDMLYWNP